MGQCTIDKEKTDKNRQTEVTKRERARTERHLVRKRHEERTKERGARKCRVRERIEREREHSDTARESVCVRERESCRTQRR